MAATRNLTTYRILLESLYVEQDLKMREVMKYMEREHAIVAGRSTYERLFKRWGLRKDTKRRAGSESTRTPVTSSPTAEKASPAPTRSVFMLS
ncbi:hypothetical protein CSOJ01_14082 [Colletotrichum sojae]|uniref:Clr5 domain-containing protein n=1 Tax=Colletotrichum sojae TaxID=2175907 RepID=A0A8H6IRG4_9PEZI|nr:hypothetical protein CSOJ01_14082 [Colletotrichum sojae]